MKKLLFLLIAIVFSLNSFGQFIAESFDGTTFPESGWKLKQISGTGLWERATVGTYPTCYPVSGAGMLKFNSYDYTATASSALISPAIDLTAITASTVLEFFMYRDNGNLAAFDSVSFYINTIDTVLGATFLGSINRIKSNYPVETGIDGWYKYQLSIPTTFNTATNYIIIKSHSAYGNSMYIDQVRILNPVTPAPPTNITFTGTTVSKTTVGWTDNSTNEYAFNLYMSTNATTGFVLVDPYVASTTTGATGGTYSKTITGLAENTQYYFKIAANGGLESSYLIGNTTTSAGSLSGVKTVGPTGNYPSLTAAFANLNDLGLVSSVDLVLQSNYVSTVETFPITPATVATSLKTIKVYPAATGLSITSDNATGTINFDGISFVTFDGRVNATGTTKDLVIANTALSMTGYTLKFINDATHNNILYCSVQGVDTSGVGVVSFGSTTGVTGNSYNTIDNCDIRDGYTTPLYAVYSSGTAGAENRNNTISNCNIYNFYRSGAVAYYPIGVGITAGNTAWSILNNSFYQTAVRNPSILAGFNVIFISSGDNHNISGNFIGGSAPLCGGTPFTVNGTSLANFFYAIRITASSGINPNSIQGNTIANISSQGLSGTRFAGVLSAAGTSNIGTITGNVIGSNLTNNSILLTSGNAGTGATTIIPIYISGGTGNIQNNIVGGITLDATSTTTGGLTFFGIYAQGLGVNIISNNIVGSNTVANSIQTIAGTTVTPVTMIGIYTNVTTAGSTVAYTNNTIANLTNNNTPVSSYLIGLRNAGTVVTSIENNSIHDLTCAATNISTANIAAIVGISSSNSGANLVISRNTIYNLTSTATTAATTINGIYRSGTGALNGKIERNLIYNLSTNSTNTSSYINGIMANGGTSSYSNNMIRLGYKDDGSDITSGLRINGIFDLAATNNYYHNTVYIGGNNIVSVDTTYAFRSFVTNTRNFSNNIFVNTRSNASGNGANYAFSLTDSASLIMNYNIFQATGVGGVLGRLSTYNFSSLTDWTTYSKKDSNSLYANPLLVAPTATIPDLHLTIGSPAESAGTLIASVLNDFDGDIRADNSPVDIGADAGYYDNVLPSATFIPTNLSTAVLINSTVEVTFNEMVRKIDNTVLDNSNIASVITFKKVSDNSDVPFTATWDAATKKIVATPTSALLYFQAYKLKVNVEDYNNNLLSGIDSTQFITIVNTDATLSDLAVNGTTVTGFAPATLTYNVVLPSGTTVIPTVTATTNYINAARIITQASTLPGTATVYTTAQDGTSHLTYTINFTVAPNTDATLSDLKVSGTTVTGFASNVYTYNVTLPYGTTVVPAVTATTTDGNATKVITPAASLPGSTTVVTTAGDGTTHLTYTVNFTLAAPSTVATLSDLTVAGTTVTGFASNVYTYSVALPYGTTIVPTVTATTTDVNATKVITPATSLPGATTVVTTAEDGTTHLTYTINFTIIAPHTDATLSDLSVNGTTVTGFSAATYVYNVVLPPGTTVVPTVTATTTDVTATKVITPAASLPGSTTVVTTAQDGVTHLTYTINFTVAIQTYTVTFNVVSGNGTLDATVDGNPIASPAIVNIGKNIIFTAAPAAGYMVKQWKSGGTTVLGNTTNNYTLSNLSMNTTVTVEFQLLNVDIDEVQANTVSIYPNPANDIVNVKMNTIINQIAIININGQEVLRSVINNNEGVINTSELSNGIYFLRIETSNGVTMKKIEISK